MNSFGLSSHQLDSDPSNKKSVDGEDVGENPDDVDKGAVADEEMGSPSCLPHVQTVDVLLSEKLLGIFFVRQMFHCSGEGHPPSNLQGDKNCEGQVKKQGDSGHPKLQAPTCLTTQPGWSLVC